MNLHNPFLTVFAILQGLILYSSIEIDATRFKISVSFVNVYRFINIYIYIYTLYIYIYIYIYIYKQHSKTKNEDLAKTFNNFFGNIVGKLGIELVLDDELNLFSIDDLILKAMAKYENYSSILRIKNYMKEKYLKFSFEFVDKLKTSKEINKLDGKKACHEHDVPVKLIKSNNDLFSHFIYHNFNNSLFSSNFSSNLKGADILPKHKKKDKSDIENYRPISIFPMLSKIYERCIYDQMYTYSEQILSKYQCGLHKGYNTQHCLLMVVEKWKEALVKGG